MATSYRADCCDVVAPKPATFRQGLRAVIDLIFVWQERHRQRAELARMDQRMLRDLGLSAQDIASEAEKPFWQG
jgi:uncharacterized protein YjiS (DUF1127 family)